jgi:arylsulfatase A
LDVSRLWLGSATKSPRDEFVYYTAQGVVEGLRQGNWKLLVKKPQAAAQGKKKAAATEPTVLLFDLAKDLGEQNNLAATQPEVVTSLRARMEALDAEITQNARAPWMKP